MMDKDSMRLKAAVEFALECIVRFGDLMDWDSRKDAIVEIAVLLHDLRKEEEGDD